MSNSRIIKITLDIKGQEVDAYPVTEEEFKSTLEGLGLDFPPDCRCGDERCIGGYLYRCAYGPSGNCMWFRSDWRCNEEVSDDISENFEIQISMDLPPQCVSFFNAGRGRVGIRNNCGECKIAVVHWTPTVGTRYYRINGFGQIIINQESQFGELIGENPC